MVLGMVSTSISALDCVCSSHRQKQCSQDLSHDILSMLLPMLALIGIFTITLIYAELRIVFSKLLRRVVHHSSKHFSLVDVYCYRKMLRLSKLIISPSTIRLTLSLIWKALLKAFSCPLSRTVWVSIKMAINARTSKAKARTKDSAEKRLVNKCHNYRQYCVAWINYPILRLTLIQNQAENANELPYKSSDEENQFEYLWNYFNSFEDVNEIDKLTCCLALSLRNPSFYHVGHYSLLKLLTEETRPNMLESNDYKCNLKVEEIIQSNIQQFIERINLQELLPIMENKCLLTNHDKEILNSNHLTYIAKADFLLTKLLPTKGHCGYVLFLVSGR